MDSDVLSRDWDTADEDKAWEHLQDKDMNNYAKDNLKSFTTSYEPPRKRCELCKYYGMIDSGYGFCKRYPPKSLRAGLLKPKYRTTYPVVAWDLSACGEFKEDIRRRVMPKANAKKESL